MWDDITIGDGNRGNSAITIRDIDHLHIAHDEVSYWIRGAFLGVNLTIFKDTEEGQTLKELLDSFAEDEKIVQHLDEIVFKNITLEQMKDAIIKAVKAGYDEGRRVQAALIRKELFHGV